MDLDYFLQIAITFFHTHMYIAIAIVVGVGIVAYLRPKQTLKTILIILGALVAAYILYYLGEALLTGLSVKEQMINK